MSEDEDPFEQFDAPDEREGDPFEQLGAPDDGADDEQEADGTDSVDEKRTMSIDDGEVSSGGGTSPSTSSTASDAESNSDPGFVEEFIDTDSTPGGTDVDTDDDPFSGMDDRDGDPFGSDSGGESAFEAVDVDTVDEDEVWASLAEDPDPSPRQSKRYTEVSKHRYCEQCEFFSEPPNAHCTHSEAEIVEYLDMETVRLLNCPIVAEQREIENEE